MARPKPLDLTVCPTQVQASAAPRWLGTVPGLVMQLARAAFAVEHLEPVDEHALVPLPRLGLAVEAPRRRQRHDTRDVTAQRTSSTATSACAGSASAPSVTRCHSAAYAAPTPCSCSTQGTCCSCMVRPPLWRRRPARAPPCPPELRLVCRQHTKLNCDWVGLVSGTCASCTAPVAQRAGKARRSRSSRAPPAAAQPAPAPCHLGVTSGQ